MKNIIWLLVGALITLLVPAMLSEPINNYFSGDRLVGTMKVADWDAKPDPVAEKKKEADEASASADFSKMTEKLLESVRNIKLSDFQSESTYAILTLKNNSDEVVNNIRLKFDTYSADILYDHSDDKLDVFQEGVKEIVIPEMKQGDERVYRIWSTSSSPTFLKDDIQTFSSTGPIRMLYVFPESEWETEQSTLEWIIEDVFPWLGLALLLTFGIVMAILSSHYETMLKAVLKDAAIYDQERQKYESDPEKYNPATSSPKVQPVAAEV